VLNLIMCSTQSEKDQCKQRMSTGIKLRSSEKLQLHSEEKIA